MKYQISEIIIIVFVSKMIGFDIKSESILVYYYGSVILARVDMSFDYNYSSDAISIVDHIGGKNNVTLISKIIV